MQSKTWYQCIHTLQSWADGVSLQGLRISLNFSPNSLSLPHSTSIRNHPLSYQSQDPGALGIHHSSFSRPSVVCNLLLTVSDYYPGTKEPSQNALLNSERMSVEVVVKNAMSLGCLLFFFLMPLTCS